MSKCNCDICQIKLLISENFNTNDPFFEQLNNIYYGHETITTSINMLIYNAMQSNFGTSSDESINVIREACDNEILNSNFMSNADMNLCNINQAAIFSRYNASLKALAIDASEFLEKALSIDDLNKRILFIADPRNIDTRKHRKECLEYLILELNI